MKQSLSPRQLAKAIGVSESSLKRWADEGRLRVNRTVGGHRRIPVHEAVRFARESNFPVVRPELLGMPDLGSVRIERQQTSDVADLLFEKLKTEQADHACALLIDLYLSGRSIAAIVDGPLRQAVDRVGQLWHEHENGIFLEHRAIDICIQSLQFLRSTIRREDPAEELGSAGADHSSNGRNGSKGRAAAANGGGNGESGAYAPTEPGFGVEPRQEARQDLNGHGAGHHGRSGSDGNAPATESAGMNDHAESNGSASKNGLAGTQLPVAVGGAMAGDPYLLPTLSAACVLADIGYREINLGPDLPLESLVQAVSFYRPQLVWLSCSVPDRAPQLRDLESLGERIQQRGASLVVGGRGLSALTDAAPRAFHHCKTMCELAAFAKGLGHVPSSR